MSLSIEPNPIHIKGSFYGPVVVDVTFSNLSHFPIVFDIKSHGEPQNPEFLLIRPQRSIIPGNGAVQITIALKAEILKHSIWPFPVEPSVEDAKTLVVSWSQLNSPGVFNVDALFAQAQTNHYPINYINLNYFIENPSGMIENRILRTKVLYGAPKVFSFLGPYTNAYSTVFIQMVNSRSEPITWRLRPKEPFWYSIGSRGGQSIGGHLPALGEVFTFIDCKARLCHFKEHGGPFDASKQTFFLSADFKAKNDNSPDKSPITFIDSPFKALPCHLDIECQFDSRVLQTPMNVAQDEMLTINFQGPYNEPRTTDALIHNSNPNRHLAYRLTAQEALWYEFDSNIQIMSLGKEVDAFPLTLMNLAAYYCEEGGQSFPRQQYIRLDCFFLDDPQLDVQKQMQQAIWKREMVTEYLRCTFDENALQEAETGSQFYFQQYLTIAFLLVILSWIVSFLF